MSIRNSIAATAVWSALMVMVCGMAAAEDSKYPDLKGQWRRAGGTGGLLAGGAGGLRYDESKPPTSAPDLGQEPPLTPEYQAIYEANLADMMQGGQGIDPTYTCIAPGMPRVMIGYSSMEFVVTPEITYILIERDHDFIAASTPMDATFPPTWTTIRSSWAIRSANGSMRTARGRYDTLVVETRGMKGPRVFDATGIPLHADNETIVKERIYLDKANPNLLHDDDHHHRPCADPAVDGQPGSSGASSATSRSGSTTASAPKTMLMSASARRSISSAPTAS